MKFTQIAIYVPNIEIIDDSFFSVFGKKLIEDKLKMSGVMEGNEVVDLPLTLKFDFDLFDGAEIEYINSSSVEHWHSGKDLTKPFLSHLGVYCSDREFENIRYLMTAVLKAKILQSTESEDHTNKRLDGTERHYQDIVFGTEGFIGFNIKITRKL